MKWWPKVKAFEGQKEFTFAPKGLTILWGPNGSGKSSLLKLLARLTHCEQGGVPLVSETSVEHFLCRHPDKGHKDGARLISDGTPVHFFDPSATPGLDGGQFDFDFTEDAMGYSMVKQSSGQHVNMGMSRILGSITKLEEVPRKIKTSNVNDLWGAAIDAATRSLERTPGLEGPRTLLLDEPERSLDLPSQRKSWEVFGQQKRFQMIIATHSVFALFIPGATYIDVQKGYLEESRKALLDWVGGFITPTEVVPAAKKQNGKKR
jgi:energy-coupling factor transporter ATP-binding protein EcfA2